MPDSPNTSSVATPNEAAEPIEQSSTPGATASGAQGGASTGNPVKSAAQEAMRKYKVAVEGKEIEVDEKELIRGYSHQRAANKALQEGKALRKQNEEFIALMKNKEKLFEVIQKLGHDPRKLSEEYLASQLEDELMDPRDKELRETKKKLQAMEDLEKKKLQAIEAKRDAALKAKYAQDYNTQFEEALKTSGLPATKPMVAEMAKYIARAAQLKFKMTAAEAAELVKQDIQEAHGRLYGQADVETLMKLIGEEGINKVRKWDTSRIKSPEQQLKTPQGQELKPREKSSGRMTPKEWRDFNRKK